MLLVIGRVRCDSDNREELVAQLKRMQDDSRREQGCLRYGFFAAVEDEDSFIAVEEWEDREALDRHFKQPHLREFAGRLLELVSERPEVRFTRSPAPATIPARRPEASGDNPKVRVSRSVSAIESRGDAAGRS